jgi:plasmid stabilization system protein ParE
VKAFLSKRAVRAAERIDIRWREHADDGNVFARELLEAIELLETTRGPGSPFPTERHPALKRVSLLKSRCHVYFEINDKQQRIEILHIWDGRRERAPKL